MSILPQRPLGMPLWQSLFVLLLLSLAQPSLARPMIMTSIHPLAFIAHEIAGDQADIEVLVPVGASPHTYSMRPSERRLLEQAEVFVWIGPEMETFLARVMQQSEMASKQIALGDGLIENGHHHHDHDHEDPVIVEESDHDGDPHLWLDPKMALEMAKRLERHLRENDQFDADQLSARLKDFEVNLESATSRLREELVPARDLALFSYHDAFRRFAERFELNLVGHLTINPERRPGARRLAQLREHLESADNPCVMTEPQFSQDWWDGLTRETNLRTSTWDPLGQSVTPGTGSYLEFLDELAGSVRKCLDQ